MDRKKDFYKNNYQSKMMEMSNKYRYFIKLLKKISKSISLNIENSLDYGCGDGSFMKACKEYFNIPNVYGCDISENAIKNINETSFAKGYVVDIDKENLPFPDNFFDFIFCGEIIEHLYDPDHFLEEIFRVCRKGGVVMLTTPNLASWFNRISLLFGYMPIFCDTGLKNNYGHLYKMNPAGHLRLYTYKAFHSLLLAHNFSIMTIKGIGINNKIGFGKKFKYLIYVVNIIFMSAKLASGILVVVQPNK